MTTVHLTGASDDLIELDGDIVEEFTYHDDAGDLVAFSDGTILKILFTREGIWRISPVVRGAAVLEIDQAPEDDDDKYTDQATLSGPDIAWAVHGVGWAKTR